MRPVLGELRPQLGSARFSWGAPGAQELRNRLPRPAPAWIPRETLPAPEPATRQVCATRKRVVLEGAVINRGSARCGSSKRRLRLAVAAEPLATRPLPSPRRSLRAPSAPSERRAGTSSGAALALSGAVRRGSWQQGRAFWSGSRFTSKFLIPENNRRGERPLFKTQEVS